MFYHFVGLVLKGLNMLKEHNKDNIKKVFTEGQLKIILNKFLCLFLMWIENEYDLYTPSKLLFSS